MDVRAAAEWLRTMCHADDFVAQAYELTEQWASDPDAFEAVEAIVRFIEANPGVDYGAPGPLVHFMERFYRHGYEQKLLESLQRCPTPPTVSMLNRLMNGATDRAEVDECTRVLGSVAVHPLADSATRSAAQWYLKRRGIVLEASNSPAPDK